MVRPALDCLWSHWSSCCGSRRQHGPVVADWPGALAYAAESAAATPDLVSKGPLPNSWVSLEALGGIRT